MKLFLLFSIFVFICVDSFAQEENNEYYYGNGNGTILRQDIENGNRITVRKHEQRFSVSPSSESWRGVTEYMAHEKPEENSKILFSLKDTDYVNTLEVAHIINETGGSFNWVKIRDDNNRIGWLNMNTKSDPYRDGIWSIIETVNINNRNWTIRKMPGGFTIGNIDVRDNPGNYGTNILFKLMSDPDGTYVRILAITEEQDPIDSSGRWSEHWVKITDEQNRIGWIFGGHGDIDRGGPKYSIPASEIEFEFNLP